MVIAYRDARRPPAGVRPDAYDLLDGVCRIDPPPMAVSGQAFVGRRTERELLAAALTSDDRRWSLLWIHGPGGIGKSALLARLAEDAEGLGAEVTWIDAQSVAQSSSTLDVLEDALVSDIVGQTRVVLVDSIDPSGTIEKVMRTELVPRMPPHVMVVVASRFAPDAEWRLDPSLRDRLRIVSLRNLDAGDAGRYLDQFGVDAGNREMLIETSRGFPLALALLADLAARDEASIVGLADGLAATPDAVSVLMSRIVDEIPSEEHRRVLEVAAVARVTSESLIRTCLDIDRERARVLFSWLRSRPYIEIGAAGVSPHALVRDVLDVDLRWRDPDAYAAVFRRIRRHIHDRLENLRGAEQRRAIADEKFVFRNLPSVMSPVDWSSWGEADVEPAQPADRDAILDLVDRFEGADASAIAERWWNRRREQFLVVRDRQDGMQGMIALLELAGIDDDVRFDPVAVAAFEFAAREAPPRSGEVITMTRFVIDRDVYQAPSPTLNAVPIVTLQRYLQTPMLSWDFLTLFEPDALNDYFAIADLPRAVGADVTVGGRRYGLFAHDFRRVAVREWLEGVTDRALAQDPSAPAAAAPELVVLSHESFTDAIRQGLRDLCRPDRLATNPLARSRLVHVRADNTDVGDALGGLLRDAVARLADDPRDLKRHRALHHTYVLPAPSQERAAEVLGLPFSTYRRHLTEGVEAVVEDLWAREIHDPPRG